MVNDAGHDDDNSEEEASARVRAPCHEIKFPIKDERAKLFGRHKELKRLRSCYNDLMMQSSSPSNKKGTVFVSGVQGVGKTALVEEFLFQPLERRRAAFAKGRGGGQQRGGGGAQQQQQQQHSVIRCNFSRKQDGYQSWDEVYSNLRDMAQNQAASVDATSDFFPHDNNDDSSNSSSSSSSSSCSSRSLLSDDDGSIISASECQDTATPQKIDDVPTSTSRESIHSLLSIICSHNCKQQQQQPLILFLDDCQNMTSMSLDVLSHLLFDESSRLGGLFLICAYSSTTNASSSSSEDITAPFNEFLDRARSRMNNQFLNSSMISIEGGGGDVHFGDMDRAVEVIHIYPLALDVVTTFIAECSGRDLNEVASLSEVMYDKTIGIISYVRSAMNELVAKNLLCYDNATRKLSWIDDHLPLKGALPNYLSGACILNDVIQSIRSQIREQLSVEVQRVLTMMACMPNLVFRASMLCELLYLEESDVRGLLQQASSLLRISSSTTQLTVSFAHEMIRQALRSPVLEEDRNALVVRVFNSHFRKWSEKRMHVGERNRAPKLRKEMTALVAFFNVIDPSCPFNGRGSLGDLADSNVSKNSNVSAGSDNTGNSSGKSKSFGDNLNHGRRRRGGRRGEASDLHKSLSVGALKALAIQDTVMSPIAADATRGNASFSEFTKNEVTPNPFTQLILGTSGTSEPDPLPPLQLCPARIQKQALESIFFPFVSDQKSVLIQHGSVYFHGIHPPTNVALDNGGCCNLENERELMIFSHGFIVADFPVSDSFHLMMSLTDGDIVTRESLLEYLRAKLVNAAASGVSIKLLRDVFQEISWPIYENAIQSLDPENHGQVKWGELHKELENMFSLPLSPIIRQEQRVQFASLFSSVARVDCLDISHSRDPRSEAISHSSLAERSFAITLNDRDGDLIFACSDQIHRDSFVSALRSVVIRAIEKSSSPESIMMRKNRGWQHLVVRNSPISYVIDNDADRLEKILDDSKKDGDDAFGEVRFKLSELDESGYAAIHYASILGHARCVEILMQKAGSNASMLDGRGLLPIDLATDDEVIAALEKKRNEVPPLTRSRPSLSSGKKQSRPSLSTGKKQSSFRRLRGVVQTRRRKVSFAEDLEESTRSLPLFSSDSEGEGEVDTDEAPMYTTSMPNVWK